MNHGNSKMNHATMKRTSICTAALAATLCVALPSGAAEPNLRAEINVDRTVVPVQRPASPLQTVSPEIISPETETHILRLTEYSEATDFNNLITPLGAAQYTGLKALSPYRGYAAIGYFPTFNLGASAGYRFISTERTSLGAWLQYNGYSYKAHGGTPKAENGDRQSVSDNTFSIGADFMQRFGKRSRLNASVDYTYGALKLPYLTAPETATGESRSINGFNGTLSFHSGYGAMAFHAGADFDHFSQGKALATPGLHGTTHAEGASENRMGVRLGAFGQFSKATYTGLEATADFLHRSRGMLLLETGSPNDAIAHPDSPVTSGQPDKRTSAIIKLMPYFGASGKNMSVRLGVDVNIATVNLGDHVHVAPNVFIGWNPASTVSVYAKFTGGDSFNSLRSLYTRMGAFAPGVFVYTSSNTPVASDFGINIGPFKGAAIELYGAYACTHNALMPVMLSYSASGTPAGAFLNTNLSGWRAGAALSYTWRDYIKARASFSILPHSYSSGFAEAYDRAKTITRVELSGKPHEKVELRATYELRTGRRYYDIAVGSGLPFEPTARSMRNSSELNFGGSYMISDAVSVNLTAENLLCRRAEQLPWVPGQGLHGLLSVEVKF